MGLKLNFRELHAYRRAFFIIFTFCMMASFSFFATRGMKQSSAASTVGFSAGNIMSDAMMANYNSMSKDDIQRFLTAKNPCSWHDYAEYQRLEATYPKLDWYFRDGHFVCLSEERFGDGEVVGTGQTAAEIIYQAAQDYHINPQVLIVLLEKEQGLITDVYPNNYQYRAATGFGCPDTAVCSEKYYGFKNQVRNAAAMFRSVLDGGWSNYPAGKTVFVQYNPSASCGGTNVYIENRATSALYRYTPYQPNASALNAGYGTGDACGAYGNRNFYLYFTDWFGSTQAHVINQEINEPDIQNDLAFEYQSHIENIGWQNPKTGGVASGTVEQSLRLEAFKLDIGQNNPQIVYRTHISNIGWESTWRHGGEISGTTGQSRAVEAIQIQLIDELANQYDVYYRVYSNYLGWMGWAKNGAPAGTSGDSRKIEAIQVAIIKKSTTVNLPTGAISDSFRGVHTERYLTFNYQAHTANIGWMNWVQSGQTAGTTGQSRQMEALNLRLSGDDSSDFTSSVIQYRAYARGLGWMNWVQSGQTAGTTGQSRPVEALELKLPDNLAGQYSIQYRVHVSDIGWMGWMKDGELAGVTDRGHQIEAIEIRLVKK